MRLLIRSASFLLLINRWRKRSFGYNAARTSLFIGDDDDDDRLPVATPPSGSER